MRAKTKIALFTHGFGFAIVIGYPVVALELFPSNQLHPEGGASIGIGGRLAAE